jgi:uncharacterized protein YcfL
MFLKLTALFISFILLSGCSVNPPKPTMPEGKWEQMNTHVPAAKLQLQKIEFAKGGK